MSWIHRRDGDISIAHQLEKIGVPFDFYWFFCYSLHNTKFLDPVSSSLRYVQT
ncbi:hypothetical protein SLEP1_g54492 [Rubroshorea leprosula]|uniref:Uncharacterized protein n=1 Tax=Rubroshorea leprosula TaxID=152421 RepID=A0AAV5MGL1_9ROSI|nr:hypothetical protein SLEP1_g54492 [Rubroshorea leprosula]